MVKTVPFLTLTCCGSIALAQYSGATCCLFVEPLGSSQPVEVNLGLNTFNNLHYTFNYTPQFDWVSENHGTYIFDPASVEQSKAQSLFMGMAYFN